MPAAVCELEYLKEEEEAEPNISFILQWTFLWNLIVMRANPTILFGSSIFEITSVFLCLVTFCTENHYTYNFFLTIQFLKQ